MTNILLPCLLLLAPAPEPKPAPADVAPQTVRVEVVSRARLRKLHLVRPDLIPHPLAYAVYC